MERLIDILSYRRAHETVGEWEMVAKHIEPYNPSVFTDTVDTPLAYVIDVAHVVDGVKIVPPVMWCCHVDTVHNSSSNMPTRQFVVHDCDDKINMMHKKDGQPLGADDGAGVWLMLEMIDANVPGTYVFHRGEECGGVGSKGLAEYYPDWVGTFKWAIAFDRKGTNSIITEQWTGTCCSNSFALALATTLNVVSDGCFNYKLDDTGVFTDTANYRHIIPECTNISVGYYNEHTKDEHLDVDHLKLLRRVMIEAFGDGIDLPVERAPTDENDRYYYPQYHYDFKYGTKSNTKYDTKYDSKGEPTKMFPFMPLPETSDGICSMDWDDLVEAVYDAEPEEVAALLLDLAGQIVQYEYEANGVGAANDEPSASSCSGYDDDGNEVVELNLEQR